MPKLKMTDELLTGVPEIDEQHRTLFKQANRMLYAVGANDRHRNGRDFLEFLKEYCFYYFNTEENIMHTAGMDSAPHAAQHKRLHQLLREIGCPEGRAPLENGDRAALHILMDDWYNNHICTWDRQMADALRDMMSSTGKKKMRPIEEYLTRDDTLSVNSIKVSKIDGWASESEMRARRRLK